MNIVVPAGIGDFSWIYAKLSTLKIPMNVRVVVGGYNRLLPFLEILPYVTSHSEIGVDYANLVPVAMPWWTTKQQLLDASKEAYLGMCANQHLEAGHDLESWFPELECDYHYEITAKPEHVRQAEKGLAGDKRFHVCFAASFAGIAGWHGWNVMDWLDYIKRFDDRHGETTSVLVGAPWDAEVCGLIEAQVKASGRKCINLCSKLHIGATIEVMRRAIHITAFPSGIAILANVIGTPALMFWPTMLTAMIHSFADPVDIENRKFVETVFIDPYKAIELTHVREDYENPVCSA